MDKTNTSFTVAMAKTLKMPNEDAATFMRQMKELTDADKAWYREALVEDGWLNLKS